MVLAELRRDKTPGCDLEDDCNLNTFAVGCDVRQRRKKIAAGAASCRFSSAASRRCARQWCLQNGARMKRWAAN